MEPRDHVSFDCYGMYTPCRTDSISILKADTFEVDVNKMLSFEYNAAMILCCSDNITKDYVLRIGQVQEVKLLIIVMNGNEEAHEATVSIEMPPAFEYLGTDDRVCV